MRKRHGDAPPEDAASCSPGGCASCSRSDCDATKRKEGESDEDFALRQRLQSRLCRIKSTIVVLSGKGGVGKSTVAVNLAMALVAAGRRVGLLDVDIHGPSIPTMLGIEGFHVEAGEEGLAPALVEGLKVVSLGLLLPDADEAVIWRGPMKANVIKQLLRDVDWGDLDHLVVDCPPGTGDEPLSVCQIIGKMEGAVIVTTPQRVAAVDVRKSVTFCRRIGVPVLGVVENMSGFACPKCGEVTPIFRSGGGMGIALSMGIPFLGAIPIDPLVAQSGDEGAAYVLRYPDSVAARVMRDIAAPLLAVATAGENSPPEPFSATTRGPSGSS